MQTRAWFRLALVSLILGMALSAAISFYYRWQFKRHAVRIGQVQWHATDVGERCGQDLKTSDPWLWFKVTDHNQVYYLCPKTRGWPFRKIIAAHTFPGTPLTNNPLLGDNTHEQRLQTTR